MNQEQYSQMETLELVDYMLQSLIIMTGELNYLFKEIYYREENIQNATKYREIIKLTYRTMECLLGQSL